MKCIFIIFITIFIVDGPNIAQKITGMDAGLKSGWGMVAGALALEKGAEKGAGNILHGAKKANQGLGKLVDGAKGAGNSGGKKPKTLLGKAAGGIVAAGKKGSKAFGAGKKNKPGINKKSGGNSSITAKAQMGTGGKGSGSRTRPDTRIPGSSMAKGNANNANSAPKGQSKQQDKNDKGKAPQAEKANKTQDSLRSNTGNRNKK